MRYDLLTTDEAIKILCEDGAIYWTEWGYEFGADAVDWLMVTIFFNTNEIHSFMQGYKTKVIYG